MADANHRISQETRRRKQRDAELEARLARIEKTLDAMFSDKKDDES